MPACLQSVRGKAALGSEAAARRRGNPYGMHSKIDPGNREGSEMRQSTVGTRNVLCITSFFPPDAVTGVHRTRAVVRYLPSSGWRPVVVTRRPDEETDQDPSLLN